MNKRYSENPEVFTEQAKSRRGIRSYMVDGIKSDMGCAVCEEKDSSCLDFHHVLGKSRNVSQMIMDKVSIHTLLSETDKCIVLCASCHRKVHSGSILAIVN